MDKEVVMNESLLKDKTVPGYLTLPKAGKGPGVLVLHAWWGLNDVFRNFCDRLAAEGFVAFAPDLYNGTIATTREEAHRVMHQMDKAAARRTLQLAVKAIAVHPAASGLQIGVVGFSMGGYYALGLACQKPKNIAAVVSFYGTGRGDFAKSQAAYLGHYAEDDEFEPLDGVGQLEDQLRAAGRPVTFHLYPAAKHWFFEPDRPEYDPAAAGLAWERTVAFLKERIPQ
jgi:carboxymethylenebutenolidase